MWCIPCHQSRQQEHQAHQQPVRLFSAFRVIRSCPITQTELHPGPLKPLLVQHIHLPALSIFRDPFVTTLGGCVNAVYPLFPYCSVVSVLILLCMHRRREVADSRATALDVVTADGEVFPVKRKLLRPCIGLTQAVRDTAQASVQLDTVDTLVFDRSVP